ncbi:hypothetical protein C1J03_12120 [Sulfitobacter sp. SK012]|uniref:hypothetical protein n=1 Tax=Sulfitobacter sp. SK012 TaxID=1389005 RepID=UPI000E0A90B3|nr:hypothetical protein [Sulfitobacter sp. SK012]AXI46703.1 hypothetical protein C1J03_12120 [Sulfitobacter sp. SK012]
MASNRSNTVDLASKTAQPMHGQPRPWRLRGIGAALLAVPFAFAAATWSVLALHLSWLWLIPIYGGVGAFVALGFVWASRGQSDRN